MMMWMWISAVIVILFGAQLNSEIEQIRSRVTRQSKARNLWVRAAP